MHKAGLHQHTLCFIQTLVSKQTNKQTNKMETQPPPILFNLKKYPLKRRTCFYLIRLNQSRDLKNLGLLLATLIYIYTMDFQSLR